MPVLYIIVALFGLCFGSFLNVCISRLPRGESIVLPRSHCPRCNHAIRWYDNIPVVSYLVLRGRCRDCRVRISPIYPGVEALTALTLVWTFHQYGLGPEFVKYAIFDMLVIVLIFTDLLERRIPHAVHHLRNGARPVVQCLHSRGQSAAGVDYGPLGHLSGGRCRFHRWRRRRSPRRRRAVLRGGRSVLPACTQGGPRVRRRHADADGGHVPRPAADVDDHSARLVWRSVVALSMRAASSRFRDYAWPYGTFLGFAAIFTSLYGKWLLDWYLHYSGMAG